MRKLALSIILCVGLSGLAVAAKEKGPTATINMKKGYDKGAGLGVGTAQFYDYAPDNRCSGRKRLYKFSPITGAQASKPIPAGQKIVLSAYANRNSSQIGTPTGPGVSVHTATCENRVQFTPQAGETYDVVQKVVVGKSCALEVLSKSSGLVRADLQDIDPASCTRK